MSCFGYLRIDDPGRIEPLPSGWHDTGDIVAIDAESFVTIMGRAESFSKIGGEMVSMAAAEALADGLRPGRAHVAVGLPDPRKGERIVLLTEYWDATRVELLAYLWARGASEMMVPTEIRHVEKVSLLGSGKTDFGAAKALVSSLCDPHAPEEDAADQLARDVGRLLDTRPGLRRNPGLRRKLGLSGMRRATTLPKK